MSTCNHGNTAPDGILRELHESQVGIRRGKLIWRHKCCLCAFCKGTQLARKRSQPPTGNCLCKATGQSAEEEILRALPVSQAGPHGLGRHQCAICALHAGFRAATGQKVFGTKFPSAQPNIQKLAKKAKYGRGGGETPEHRRLKCYVKDNPQVLGLENVLCAEAEYSFWSADQVDVLFKCEQTWIGVEVKSSLSDSADIMRGIFQCMKYEALISATQRFEQVKPDSRVILALGAALPSELEPIVQLLKIEVRDELRVPVGYREQ